MRTVGIVGAGAWGTALAQAAAHGDLDVLLWDRDPEVAAAIRATRRNPKRLQEIVLSPRVAASADLATLGAADVLLLTVPAQTLRGVVPLLPPGNAPCVICAKGLEQATGRRLSEVFAEEAPDRALAVLSGPNFAREVAQGLPAATTLACQNPALGRTLAESLSSERFRVYRTDDVVGVEIGGAVKNVLAIAAGIVTGLSLGENARAGLITRGLAELTRLGEALGARPETLAGLSGLGDAILTCTSLTSRNTALGHAIGHGADPRGDPAAPLAEGAFTAAAVARLSREHGIEMPIVEAVDAILAGRLAADEAVDQLMRRPLRAET